MEKQKEKQNFKFGISQESNPRIVVPEAKAQPPWPKTPF